MRPHIGLAVFARVEFRPAITPVAVRIGGGGDPEMAAFGQQAVPHAAHLCGHLVEAPQRRRAGIAIQPTMRGVGLVPGCAFHADHHLRRSVLPCTQLRRSDLAPDPGRCCCARRMVDDQQRLRLHRLHGVQRRQHRRLGIAEAAVQQFGAVVVALQPLQLRLLVGTRCDDQRRMLGRRHIEFHPMELDQRRHRAPGLLQRWPGLGAGHPRMARAAMIGMHHPRKPVGGGLLRIAAARVRRITAADRRGRRRGPVPGHAPFAMHMMVAGQPLAWRGVLVCGSRRRGINLHLRRRRRAAQQQAHGRREGLQRAHQKFARRPSE